MKISSVLRLFVCAYTFSFLPYWTEPLVWSFDITMQISLLKTKEHNYGGKTVMLKGHPVLKMIMPNGFLTNDVMLFGLPLKKG